MAFVPIIGRIIGPGSAIYIAVDASGNFTASTSPPTFIAGRAPIDAILSGAGDFLEITDTLGTFTSAITTIASDDGSSVPILGFAAGKSTGILLDPINDLITSGSFSTSYAAILGGIFTRTLNIAGPELVLNGGFTTDLSNWTDASSAGGTVAWNSSNSGVARLTNTTGTARLRQNPAVTSGQVYSFFGQNVATSGAAASVALGSTTPGSTDLLSYASNATIAARAGVKEFTAPTSVVNIQIAQGVAGNNDWKGISLRQLISTIFYTGKVFTEDFSLKPDTPDGNLGVNPDNIPWRQMAPQNASHVYPTISGGKMVMAASGSTTSAGYPFWNFGTGKVAGIRCDLIWTGSGASCAMVSLTPSGSQPTVTDITTNSLHIVFSDTKVDISTYVASILTTETVNYGASITPGVTYTGVGWSLLGSTLTIYLPDGTTLSRTDSKFSQVYGNIGIPEQFYGSGVTGSIAISKVSMTLG